MTYTIENFEAFLLILVRITGFAFTAPFFSLKNVPNQVKIGLSIFMTAIVFYTVPYTSPEYESVIDYAIIIIKEALAGAIMGFFANIAYQVLSFAGQMIDTEIGFSMINELDPTTQVQNNDYSQSIWIYGTFNYVNYKFTPLFYPGNYRFFSSY